jgi:putative ABC transport system substrate-binding protein
MRRRDIVMLVGSAAAWPLASSAQQAVPVVGYLSGRSVNSETPLRTPFLKALEGAGFVVGQNVVIDYRFSDGRDERLPILAAELVQRQVTIVVATDRPSAVAAKAATNTIPLVFHSGDDPVRNGLVQSFNSPGGNATGISVLNNQLGPKRLSLLREIIPKPGVIAFVVNQNSTSTPTQLQEMKEAAQAIAQPLLILNAANESEIDEAFATMSREKVACRADSQRRQTERTAGGAIFKLRVRAQSQNCPCARTCRAAYASRSCRRGDRINKRDVRFWPLADIDLCNANVRFRG